MNSKITFHFTESVHNNVWPNIQILCIARILFFYSGIERNQSVNQSTRSQNVTLTFRNIYKYIFFCIVICSSKHITQREGDELMKKKQKPEYSPSQQF